ncbi:MAG: ribosome-binding factor A, partial [Edwardsiella sp. (in: enterobacteria)]
DASLVEGMRMSNLVSNVVKDDEARRTAADRDEEA